MYIIDHKIYKDIHIYPVDEMRRIKIEKKKIELTDGVEIFYEKKVTPFGNSAKIDAPRKYRGRRAYVVILKG